MTTKISASANQATLLVGSQPVANLPATCGIAFCKNKLINGEVTRINQRAFNGVWSAKNTWNSGNTIAQQELCYGYDMWAKASSTDMLQVIEAGNFRPSTVHTLSGTGVTTQQITSPSSGNWTITVPQGSTNVQVEEGTEATPFEIRPVAFELAQCQRYYEQVVVTWSGQVIAAAVYYAGASYATQKRTTPDVSSVSQSGIGNGGFNTRSGTGSNKTITWGGAATGNINGAGFQDLVAASAVL